MPKIIEVIYENGVFKPLQKADLKEKTKGKVIITEGLECFFGIFKKRILVDEERDLMMMERI